MVAVKILPKHIVHQSKESLPVSAGQIYGAKFTKLPYQCLAAYRVREVALDLPQLKERLAAINLALSDPNPSVRLRAGKRLADLWAKNLLEADGVQKACLGISEHFNHPQIYYHQRDPRLPTHWSYSPERALENFRLGSVMGVQAVFKNPESPLRPVLAKYLATSGLVETIQVAQSNQELARQLIATNFALPPLEPSKAGQLNNLFSIVQYCIVASCLAMPKMKQAYFPTVKIKMDTLDYPTIRISGLANSIGEMLKGISDYPQHISPLPAQLAEQRTFLAEIIADYNS